MKTSIISLILFFFISSIFPQDSTWTASETDLNEVISKRNYFSKTFYNEATNKYTTRITSNLMHYKDSKGDFRNIDKTIKVSEDPEYSYKVTKGIYQAYFKSDITSNYPVVFRLRNSKYFQMQPFALAYYDTQSKEHTVLGRVRSSEPQVRDNSIVYPGAFPGVHIKYIYNERSLKEEVVLTDNFRNNRLPSPAEYGYDSDNTILVLLTRIKYSNEMDVYEHYAKIDQKKLENSDLDDYTNTKSLHFINKERLQFMLPVDVAYMAEDDSSESGNPVIPLKRRLRRINGHLTVLTGIEYNQLMDMPDGSVILDPTVATVLHDVDDDTWLENTSVKGSLDKFIVGKCASYPKKRSVIKFDISAIPSGATIDSSMMYVYWYYVYKPSWSSESIITRYVRANRVFTSWSESTATRDNPWNTAYGDFGSTSTYDYYSTYEDEVYFDFYATGYCWKGFDLTTATGNWHSGTWTNNGVVLWATNEDTEGRTLRFRSSEYSDVEYRPFLEITYEHDYAKNYYLKDHLGNIRVTLDDDGDVIGYNDYYPFGLTMTSRSIDYALTSDIYKYSSKELDEENGLDWYYFGARYYDAEVGRFLSVDPMFDRYPNLNPYNYVGNNPIAMIDPTGETYYYINDSDSTGHWEHIDDGYSDIVTVDADGKATMAGDANGFWKATTSENGNLSISIGNGLMDSEIAGYLTYLSMAYQRPTEMQMWMGAAQSISDFGIGGIGAGAIIAVGGAIARNPIGVGVGLKVMAVSAGIGTGGDLGLFGLMTADKLINNSGSWGSVGFQVGKTFAAATGGKAASVFIGSRATIRLWNIGYKQLNKYILINY